MERNPSLGGTYTDIEPMGLFWSMTQTPGQKFGLRFAKKDVTTPMKITLSVHKGHLDLSTLQTDPPIAKTQIQKLYMRPGVEIIKVCSGRIRGRVFKPKGPGPFKGVIDIFGSSGGQTEFRAALLASRGFAAYALPYFRYEDLPTIFQRLELDYFEEATDWLQSQSFVQSGGIGLCAVSYGAEIAAKMATSFPEKISACVSISGSCLHTTIPMSYKGVERQYLGADFFRIKTIKPGEVPVINMYDACDPLETAPAEALLELEKAQHLLFFVGLDDQNWPAPVFIDGAERRLKALGCNNFEIVRYPGAGHLIEPPYAPVTLVSYYKLAEGVIQWGGSLREHQRAQEDHWPKVLQFLDKYIGSQSTSQSQWSKL